LIPVNIRAPCAPDNAFMFDDRLDAASQLAAALECFRGTRPLVMAIPRGAVPLAARIAEALDGDLDVILLKKIASPVGAERVVGAVAEDGWSFVADFAAAAGAPAAYVEHEKRRQLALLGRRRERYTPWRECLDPADRVAIVVDDGLANGNSMAAALKCVRAHRPRVLVCAVPVASGEAIERVAPHADRVVCLAAPAWFTSVDAAYRHLGAVSDPEVTAILRTASPAGMASATC